MQVYQIYTGSDLRNFTYVLMGRDKKAIVIDPFSAQQVLEFLQENKAQCQAIINTHEHFDHWCGNEGLLAKFQCPVYAHPRAVGAVYGGKKALNHGEVLNLGGGAELEAWDTPGHTFAHICLVLRAEEGKRPQVFTGDTLFNAGVGNCSGGGEVHQLYRTVTQLLKDLPDETLLYPGHDYLENNLRFTLNCEPDNGAAKQFLPQAIKLHKLSGGSVNQHHVSTFGEEKSWNSFFRLQSPSLLSQLNPSSEEFASDLASEEEVFVKLRGLRDKW